LDLSRQVR